VFSVKLVRRVNNANEWGGDCCTTFECSREGDSQGSNATPAKHRVLYAPRPEYPLAARKRHWSGAGVFACNIRSNGTVASVDVLRSTGHQMLDQAAITALRQWSAILSGTSFAGLVAESGNNSRPIVVGPVAQMITVGPSELILSTSFTVRE